jgi:hypothetical protein
MEEDDESPRKKSPDRHLNSNHGHDDDEDEDGGDHTPDELDAEDQVLETLCKQWMEEFGMIKFPTLIAGKRLWYLDVFKPKGSQEKISMW